jgi:hypothetical protein
MDIFRVLGTTADQEGAKRIVVACLAYLLTPDEDHGLGAALLWRVLRELEGVGGALFEKLSETVGRRHGNRANSAQVVVKAPIVKDPWSEPAELDLVVEIRVAGKRFTIGLLVDISPVNAEPGIRFSRAAKDLRRVCDEASGGQDQEAILVYLVPPDKAQLRGLSTYPDVDLDPYAILGPIALPWMSIEPLPDLPRLPLEAKTSMERLLQQILLAHVHGVIPSADARALDLMRDLRSACLGGFELRAGRQSA